MPEPIVSFDTIQRCAREAAVARARRPGEARAALVLRQADAAAAGQCSHTACPWPLDSAAGQAFQLEYSACKANLENQRNA